METSSSIRHCTHRGNYCEKLHKQENEDRIVNYKEIGKIEAKS